MPELTGGRRSRSYRVSAYSTFSVEQEEEEVERVVGSVEVAFIHSNLFI